MGTCLLCGRTPCVCATLPKVIGEAGRGAAMEYLRVCEQLESALRDSLAAKKSRDEWLARAHQQEERANLVQERLDSATCQQEYDAFFASPAPANPSTCEWRDDGDGCYQTSCGHVFEYLHGRASDNGAKYCQYCGKRLVEISEPEEGEEG